MNKYLENVMTFAEATEKWGLGESTLRSTVKTEKLVENEDYKKSGKVWLITKEAMIRVYGKQKLTFTGEELYNNKDLQQIVENTDVISYTTWDGDCIKFNGNDTCQLFSPEAFWKFETNKENNTDWYLVQNGIVPIRVYKKMKMTVEV